MKFKKFFERDKSEAYFHHRDKYGSLKAEIPASIALWTIELDKGEWVDYRAGAYPNVSRAIRIKENQSMEIPDTGIVILFWVGDKLIPWEG